MVIESSTRTAFTRARIVRGGALAASAAVVLAAAPAAGAHAFAHSHFPFGHGPSWSHRGNDRLVPDSLAISGTVFPRRGVNLSVGQNCRTRPTTDRPSPSPRRSTLRRSPTASTRTYSTTTGLTAASRSIRRSTSGTSASRGQPLGSSARPDQRDDDELLVQVGARDQPLDRRSGPELQRLQRGGRARSTRPTRTLPARATRPTRTSPARSTAWPATSTHDGRWTFTDTNSYSGDNERAVLLNAPTTSSSRPATPTTATRARSCPASSTAPAPRSTPSRSCRRAARTRPPARTSFRWARSTSTSLPQYSTVNDKAGKDTNFRGLTVYNNVVYYTKGSGSNGINTVYFVDTTGNACTGTGVGLPQPGAALPTPGVTYPMCVLSGFNTGRAKTLTTTLPPLRRRPAATRSASGSRTPTPVCRRRGQR